MSKWVKIAVILSIFTGFFYSCKHSYVAYESIVLEVSDSLSGQDKIEELIRPYSDQLKSKMEERLGYAACDHVKNRPEGNLGDWVADLTLERATVDFRDSGEVKLIALFNHGGLRAPIGKGDILLSSIYELMPFDNEIVYIQLLPERWKQIHEYLRQSGGEPIAGFSYADSLWNDNFWVVTSDYLANGGDRMNFFKEPLQSVKTGRLLRDEIIDFVRENDTICVQMDGRWQ